MSGNKMHVALLGLFGQVILLYSSDMLIGTKCLNKFSYFNNHCKTFVVKSREKYDLQGFLILFPGYLHITSTLFCVLFFL